MFKTYAGNMCTLKGVSVLLLGTVSLLSLCACVGIDGEPPSSSNVERFVSSHVRGDKYEFVGCEQTGELPKEYTYEYRSLDRDLSFTARAYLSPIHFDASVVGYEPSVDTTYADDVHALYDDEMRDIIEDNGMNISSNMTPNMTEVDSSEWVYDTNTSRLVITDYDQIDAAADALVEMDSVYRKELRYNSGEWCDEHPYARVSLTFVPEDEFEPGMLDLDAYSVGETFASVDIDCTVDADDTAKELKAEFAQAIANGGIDAPLPDEHAGHVHPEQIDVYLDGEIIEYQPRGGEEDHENGDGDEPDYSIMYGREGARWDEDGTEYVMTIDVGDRKSGTSAGETRLALCVIPMFAEHGSVTADANDRKCIIEWMAHDEKSRRLVSVVNGSGTEVVSVTYTDGDGNERKLDISDNNYSGYRVSIPVSDFADMFGFEYEVDEAERRADFSTPER